MGTPVTVISATDADIGKNAELTYRIVSGDRDQFYMDSIFVTGSGVVRIKKVQLNCDCCYGETSYLLSVKPA